MVRALTFVSDTSNLDVVPSVAKGNQEKHAIGLGAMGATILHKTKCIMVTKRLLILRQHSSWRWIIIQLKRQWSWPENAKEVAEFDKSAYADGTYFDKYLARLGTKNTKSAAAFANHHVPTQRIGLELKGKCHDVWDVSCLSSCDYSNRFNFLCEWHHRNIVPIVNRIEERQRGWSEKCTILRLG